MSTEPFEHLQLPWGMPRNFSGALFGSSAVVPVVPGSSWAPLLNRSCLKMRKAPQIHLQFKHVLKWIKITNLIGDTTFSDRNIYPNWTVNPRESLASIPFARPPHASLNSNRSARKNTQWSRWQIPNMNFYEFLACFEIYTMITMFWHSIFPKHQKYYGYFEVLWRSKHQYPDSIQTVSNQYPNSIHRYS
jgi:hypothetical protein